MGNRRRRVRRCPRHGIRVPGGPSLPRRRVLEHGESRRVSPQRDSGNGNVRCVNPTLSPLRRDITASRCRPLACQHDPIRITGCRYTMTRSPTWCSAHVRPRPPAASAPSVGFGPAHHRMVTGCFCFSRPRPRPVPTCPSLRRPRPGPALPRSRERPRQRQHEVVVAGEGPGHHGSPVSATKVIRSVAVTPSRRPRPRSRRPVVAIGAASPRTTRPAPGQHLLRRGTTHPTQHGPPCALRRLRASGSPLTATRAVGNGQNG